MASGKLYAQVHITKRTRRNQVVRIVREHYLRDDIDNPLRTKTFHGETASNDQVSCIKEECEPIWRESLSLSLSLFRARSDTSVGV